jgi:hypothetical protein
VELANKLWNWPTTCGTGQQPVELANNVELVNNLRKWSTACETSQQVNNLWNWPVTWRILELCFYKPLGVNKYKAAL